MAFSRAISSLSRSLLVTALPLSISPESPWTQSEQRMRHQSDSVFPWPILTLRIYGDLDVAKKRDCGLCQRTAEAVRSRWMGLKAVPYVNPRHSGKDQSTMSCAGLCKTTLRGYQTWGHMRRGKALPPMDTQSPPRFFPHPDLYQRRETPRS